MHLKRNMIQCYLKRRKTRNIKLFGRNLALFRVVLQTRWFIIRYFYIKNLYYVLHQAD